MSKTSSTSSDSEYRSGITSQHTLCSQACLLETHTPLFDVLLSLEQDLEQMAREQDRETDRIAIQAETESQRKQMLRCV